MADKNETPRRAAQARISEIRSIALAEILTKSGGFDDRKYFDELQKLKKRPHSFAWFEASIMTSVIGRHRQPRIDGFLNKLHYRRNMDEQADLYEEFVEMLAAYRHPEEFVRPVIVRQLFSNMDHNAIWSTIEGHLKTLKDEGYDAFLNSGTLLGVVRDKALIDHDDDVDLALILKAKSVTEAAEEWNTLRGRLREIGLLHKITDRNPAIYKLTPAGGVNIDLFPAWESDGKFYVFPHTHGGLKTSDVLPLKKCSVTGYPVPNQPEKMLVQNYGDDWKTPDPHFQFPWARANKKFAPFLQEVTV